MTMSDAEPPPPPQRREGEQGSLILIKQDNPLKRIFDETAEELMKSNKKRRKETWNASSATVATNAEKVELRA